MSATNKTANYDLPQFVADDKPSWLGDWNHTMEVIDGAIYQAQATADSATVAEGDLAQRVTEAEGDIDVLQASDLTQNTQISGNTGSINTINSLIGNGEPTTTDKTLIGAINEINAKIPEQGTVKAEDVEYDNTSSGLTADDVQEAIDEVNSAVELNTGSLVAGADRFYFDVQNGEYGYNTSASRGADTFHPFKSEPNIQHIDIASSTTSGGATATCTYTGTGTIPADANIIAITTDLNGAGVNMQSTSSVGTITTSTTHSVSGTTITVNTAFTTGTGITTALGGVNWTVYYYV